MNIVESKIETLEKLLRALSEAAYSTLCESNCVEEEMSTHLRKALDELTTAMSNAEAYFDPAKAEKDKKWADACATAAYIMDRYKEGLAAKQEHPNLVRSSLQRNIADAINGSLKQTMEDRKLNKHPETMIDVLDSLVRKGELHKYEPESE